MHVGSICLLLRCRGPLVDHRRLRAPAGGRDHVGGHAGVHAGVHADVRADVRAGVRVEQGWASAALRWRRL